MQVKLRVPPEMLLPSGEQRGKFQQAGTLSWGRPIG